MSSSLRGFLVGPKGCSDTRQPWHHLKVSRVVALTAIALALILGVSGCGSGCREQADLGEQCSSSGYMFPAPDAGDASDGPGG